MSNMTVTELIQALESIEDKSAEVLMYDRRLDDYIALKSTLDTVEVGAGTVELNFNSLEDSLGSERRRATVELDFTFENVRRILEQLNKNISVDSIETVYSSIEIDEHAIEVETVALAYYTQSKLRS